VSRCLRLRKGEVFSARCIATGKAWTYREHCFYRCVLFGMCLLGRRLAMNVPLLLDASWLERVYRAVAWQSVDQIRYNTVVCCEATKFGKF
jgi:hypothetical protein